MYFLKQIFPPDVALEFCVDIVNLEWKKKNAWFKFQFEHLTVSLMTI